MAITNKRKEALLTKLKGCKAGQTVPVSIEEMHWLSAQYTFQPPGPETAEQFLANAASVMQQRGETYDSESGERSMGNTVTAFNAITGHELKESDGWLFMETLKNVRQYQTDNYHADSAEDGVSYASLKAEALARGD